MGQEPQATWLEMTETGKAKTAIRRALREADRDKYIIMGQQLLRAAFEHYGEESDRQSFENTAKKLELMMFKSYMQDWEARVAAEGCNQHNFSRLFYSERT